MAERRPDLFLLWLSLSFSLGTLVCVLQFAMRAFDSHIKRDVTCTVLHLDLTTETSAELLFSM